MKSKKCERKTEVGTFKLALSFVGCFLGAGFVSGQEILQYFYSFGKMSIPGIILAIGCLAAMTIAAMLLARRTGRITLDRLAVGNSVTVVRYIIGIFTTLVFLGLVSIMTAGIASLGEQMLKIPVAVGSAVVIILIMFCAYFGLKGMMTVFSAVVPVLVVAAIIICVVSICRNGLGTISFDNSGSVNPLLNNWILSAFNYTALNYFGAVAILAPLSEKTPKKKNIYSGIIIGGTAMVLVCLGMLLALMVLPSASKAELPMLEVAGDLGKAIYIMYAILLALGMYGTAISEMVGAMNYTESISMWLKNHRAIFLTVIAVVLYFASLFGFSKLIGAVYPMLGYFGFLIIILIIIQCFKSRQ